MSGKWLVYRLEKSRTKEETSLEISVFMESEAELAAAFFGRCVLLGKPASLVSTADINVLNPWRSIRFLSPNDKLNYQ